MARFRVTVTAQLESPFALDARRLRIVTQASSAKLLSHDTVHIVLSRRGSDAECAANHALIDINKALGPQTRFARPPAWQAKRTGRFGLGERTAGRWTIGDDDDGLGGVREPRRPIPPTGHASIALDPPGAA
jgi:hypothetical protein